MSAQNPIDGMSTPHWLRKILRDHRNSQPKVLKKRGRKLLPEEERVARAVARKSAKSKSGWSREELVAYRAAVVVMKKVTKKYFKEPRSRSFHYNGKVFDTAGERDDYIHNQFEIRRAVKYAEQAARLVAMEVAREERRARAIKTKRERQRWKDVKKRKLGVNGKILPWDFEETQLAAQGGECFYCKVKVGDDYHIDHVIPVAQGGSHHPDNLVVACPTCNMKKSDKMPWEFKVAA